MKKIILILILALSLISIASVVSADDGGSPGGGGDPGGSSGAPTFTLEDTINNGGYYYDVWGDGDYIYTACTANGVRSYSFDGSSFTLEDSQDDGGYYQGVWGDGTYIYAGCYGDGVRAYSLDGSTFTLEDSQDHGGYYYGVWGDGTYIYTACHLKGVRAYSFDGSSFTLEDSQDDGGYYYDVWGDGTYIYTACSGDGVRAYGSGFNLLDSQDDGGGYLGVWGDGNYIYTACEGDGVRAYSFDGSSFTLEDTLDNGGDYQGVWGDGTYIYAACSYDGVRAYSFDGSTFTLEDTQADGGEYLGVWGDGTYIYSVSGYSGVRAYSGFESVTNNAPAISSASDPTDIYPMVTQIGVTVNDTDADTMNITFRTNESGTWQDADTNTTVNNGTYYCMNVSWIDAYNTTYYWSANVTDGTEWTNETYNFTTKSIKPTINDGWVKYNSPSPQQGINVTWVADSAADSSYIEWNTTATWDRGEGTQIPDYSNYLLNYYYTNDTSVPYHTTRYYQVWGYNETTATYSSDYAAGSNTSISPPVISDVTPADGATGIVFEPTCGGTVDDPDGDSLEVTFASNHTGNWQDYAVIVGSVPGGTGVDFTAEFADEYNTIYWWSMNVTDGTYWTNETYSFTTYGVANFTYSIENNTITVNDTSDFGEYWMWDFGDGFEVSGRYNEHKNLTHTYTINWSTVNNTVDHMNYTVSHEVCNDDLSYCGTVAKTITLERPETVEDDETVITIPTSLIITFFVLLALLTVISLFFDQIKDLFKIK